MTGVVHGDGEARQLKDAATPHARQASGAVEAIDWYPDEKQPLAASSVKASARDLGRWLRFQLGDGSLDGKRMLTAQTLSETHRPQIIMPPDDRPPLADTAQMSYGLGWRILDHRGKLLLEHDGAVDGFRASPAAARRIGMALLLNVDDEDALTATSFTLVDHLLGLPPKDWNAYYLEKRHGRGEGGEGATRGRRVRERRAGTKPAHELADYAGVYEDSAYGTLRILVSTAGRCG